MVATNMLVSGLKPACLKVETSMLVSEYAGLRIETNTLVSGF